MIRQITLLFAACTAYAVVRYAVFLPENRHSLPVFIVNKGVSMAAALCFAVAFWRQWRGHGAEAAGWFRAGVFGSFLHVPMSLAILRPGYFREFFADERLSFTGEMVFLLGSAAAGGLYLLTRPNWSPMHRWWLSLATVAVLLGHTLCMGLARGLNINSTHAYLPPMWLLSAAGIALGAVFLLQSRPPEGKE
jgi:hypothetical protein